MVLCVTQLMSLNKMAGNCSLLWVSLRSISMFAKLINKLLNTYCLQSAFDIGVLTESVVNLSILL